MELCGHSYPACLRWKLFAPEDCSFHLNPLRKHDNGCLSRSRKSQRNLLCRNQHQHDELRRQSDDTESVMLLEKIGKLLLREYMVDENGKLVYEEKQVDPVSYTSNSLSSFDLVSLSGLPQSFRDFFLPTDFPDSVSHDYLRYMIWQFPTNVTGWACSTLVTSSLLKAVGVDASAGTTVAATAAIKWVSKDGLGAFGRLFIGGRFGRVFDDDPKQWRMYAECIGSFGSIFELLTPVKPEWFLPLASLGRLTKAVGRGLKDPAFKVIQNHFAISGNMGEVSAKEEVWEVVAELLGIGFGVILLGSHEIATSYSLLVLTWASTRSLHLWLRYKSLESLQFTTINFKRAFIMAEKHVIGSPIPGISECNSMEDILIPWQLSRPYIRFGCSLRDAFADKICKSEVEMLLSLYSNELHVIVLDTSQRHRVQIKVIFKEGSTNATILRALWQAEWIMALLKSQGDLLSSMQWREGNSALAYQMNILAESLTELAHRYCDFLYKIEEAGWETSKLVLKVPKDVPYLAIARQNDLMH